MQKYHLHLHKYLQEISAKKHLRKTLQEAANC